MSKSPDVHVKMAGGGHFCYWSYHLSSQMKEKLFPGVSESMNATELREHRSIQMKFEYLKVGPSALICTASHLQVAKWNLQLLFGNVQISTS